jgi:hypothetical protein
MISFIKYRVPMINYGQTLWKHSKQSKIMAFEGGQGDMRAFIYLPIEIIKALQELGIAGKKVESIPKDIFVPFVSHIPGLAVLRRQTL